MSLLGSISTTAANGTTESGLTASVGTKSDIGGAGVILNNRLRQTVGGYAQTGQLLTPAGTTADYSVSCDAYLAGHTTGDSYTILYARSNGSGDGYRAYIVSNSSGANVYIDVISGASQIFVTGASGFVTGLTPGNGVNFRFDVASAGTLEAYVDGVLFRSASRSDFASQGKAVWAIQEQNAPASGAVGLHMSNLQVNGTLVGGGSGGAAAFGIRVNALPLVGLTRSRLAGGR